MTITEMLNLLAELQAQADAYRMTWEEKRAEIMAPVQKEIDDLDAEWTPALETVNQRRAELETAVRLEVLKAGSTYTGDRLMAVFNKGRVSWDTKALEGYSVAHPEIVAFMKVGEPSVTIRKR